MSNQNSTLSVQFINWVRSQKMSKRAREALEIMIQEGSVTTVDLKNRFGFNHPPRAMGDLKDAGVPFTKTMVKVEGESRRVARYELLDDINVAKANKPRKVIPKKVKTELIAKYGKQCQICGGTFSSQALQVDHRIPFRINGDPET